MLQGFKEFISRGNALDLAVGVVIGAAFTAVVNSIVNGVLNPLIAGLVGKPNFDDVLAFTINGAVVQPGAVVTTLVNFLLVSAAVYFFVVVPMNQLAARRKVQGAEPEAPADDVRLLTEIRDLLAAERGAGGLEAPDGGEPGTLGAPEPSTPGARHREERGSRLGWVRD
ncbi:large conductance mechanosensitive channel protein MscL [Georgenia thermotolerans]|uniref:Large-conductance mechanosensitive channel n=1 Tax=Georgenia thermotolerans TaxID=527326 RepID=A0A7J5UJI7_9MICO|nr:large conductance mechanosensitive channel protein MscL [Georgenia thermotolerans]KAE8762532.1 large conductance mechanosensitive channel protein MscL [Georgenia thermotolerans]